jgi:hypothetical protein
VAHAPAQVVELERKKQADAETKIAALRESLKALRRSRNMFVRPRPTTVMRQTGCLTTNARAAAAAASRAFVVFYSQEMPLEIQKSCIFVAEYDCERQLVSNI